VHGLRVSPSWDTEKKRRGGKRERREGKKGGRPALSHYLTIYYALKIGKERNPPKGEKEKREGRGARVISCSPHPTSSPLKRADDREKREEKEEKTKKKKEGSILSFCLEKKASF